MTILTRLVRMLMFMRCRRYKFIAAIIIWLSLYLLVILYDANLPHKLPLIGESSHQFTTKHSHSILNDTSNLYSEVNDQDDQLKEFLYMSPEQIETLKRYKPFDQFFTGEEKSIIYDLLEKFDAAMKKYEIFYVIYGGTLLGSYRFHDIIPWDDDVDVFVHIKDGDRVEQALSDYAPRYTYGEFNHGKFYRSDGAKLSRYPWKYPFVDVIFFNDTKLTVTETYMANDKRNKFTKDYVYPPHKRPLGPLMLPAPRDSLRFLIQMFGATNNCSWMTYSHAVEVPLPSVKDSVECRKLRSYYPFVHREPLPLGEYRVGVKEKLISPDGEILQSLVVDEPADAINEDYSLKPFEPEEQRIKSYLKQMDSDQREEIDEFEDE